jgi:hypothetical protein
MPLRLPAAPGPALVSTWSKVGTYSSKLRESLEELQRLGGACRVAASARWTPSDHDRALGDLLATVEALELELGQLELRRRHFATRSRRLG